MVQAKSMGLGAMFVFLVVAVIVLPMIVRYVGRVESHYVISGFADLQESATAAASGPSSADGGVAFVPAVGRTSKLPTWRPDPNTDYLCRSPNEDGNPCPEGYFCDGPTQSCIPKFVGNQGPWEGYYS
jgi:hypothetical protein